MRKLVAAVLAGTVIALAGCADMQKSGQAGVSLQAQTMLLQAESDINMAKGKKVNTDAAQKAYDLAKQAAANGDSGATVKHSQAASKEALAAVKRGK